MVDERDLLVLCFALGTDFLIYFFDGARCLMELADFRRQSQNDLRLRAQGHRQRPHCPAGEQRCSGVQIRLGGNSYLAMCCNAGRRKSARQSDISSREK